MATQPLPLSKEMLAQFNHSLAMEPGAWGPSKHYLGSISTNQSSKDKAYEHSQSRVLVRRESVSTCKRLSFSYRHQGDRVSFSGLQLPQPIKEICLENNYRTGPEPGGCFSSRITHQIMQTTLDSYLDGAVYSPVNCSQLAKSLADLVLAKLKDVKPPRYKLLCQVILGQNGKHGIRVASRGLLNKITDNHAEAVYQNRSLFAVAIVHGAYCE